jgi:hypothetical protein
VSPLAGSLLSHQLGSLVTVDDNYLPYTSISATPGGTYSLSDIDGFIVPLPDKIYYPASAVDRHSIALHRQLLPVMNLPAANDLVRRFYVTTLSALRRFARENESQLGNVLVGAIMRLRTAQFIWVVEYASSDQWNNCHIAARAILDATASPYDSTPMWLVHDESQAIFFDRDASTVSASVVDLKRPPGTPLGRMEQNLRPIVSRT